MSNITESINKDITLKKIKMNTDDKILGLEAPLQSFNFMYLFCGKPMSGKTSLMLNLITTKNKYYYQKFDRIEIFSPSLHTIDKGLDLDESRFHDTVDAEILEKILKENDKAKEKILFVFDDVIASISKIREVFIKMVYNRRHLGGGISIILVSQVYNKIPLEIRKACSGIFMFSTTNKREIQSLYDDFISMPKPMFDKILRFVFKSPHDFLYIDTNTDDYYNKFNLLKFDIN
jgi:hypothetical protein